MCCLVCTDIALDGFKWQTVWISCDCTSAASALSPGCGRASFAVEWGQSPCFYGDLTCCHPIKQPLSNSMELVQARERRRREGSSISKEKPGKSVLVCCNVSVREWTEAIPAGQCPGRCWASPPWPPPALPASHRKHSRDKVVMAWSCLGSLWRNVFQHNTSTLV